MKHAIVLFLAINGLAAAHAASAQASSYPAMPLRAEEVASIKSFDSWAVSPDEKFYAYSICNPMEEEPAHAVAYNGCSLWLREGTEGSLRRITNGMGTLPSWSPDGRHLAYQAFEGNELKLWLWSREDGSTRKVSDLRLPTVGQIPEPARWLPDGKQLVVKYAAGYMQSRKPVGEDAATVPSWAREVQGVNATVSVVNLPKTTSPDGSQRDEKYLYMLNTGVAVVDVESVSAEVKLTHPRRSNFDPPGRGWRLFLSRRDVDPGASGGDQGFRTTRALDSADHARDGVIA